MQAVVVADAEIEQDERQKVTVNKNEEISMQKKKRKDGCQSL